jgi:hypothetical protein
MIYTRAGSTVEKRIVTPRPRSEAYHPRQPVTQCYK